MQSPITEVTAALSGQSLRVLVWDADLVDMWSLDHRGARVAYRGMGSQWHLHPELELTVITRGEGVLYVGDHIGRFRAPDCILLGSRVPHVWKSHGAIAGISAQFSLDAGAGLAHIPELAAVADVWAHADYGLRWQGGSAERVIAGLERLEGMSTLARLTCFLDLVEIMHSAPPEHALRLSERALVHSGRLRSTEAMRRVLDHLISHFRDDLRLGDLVAMSGCSQATFCRHFAALTGRTCTAYLNAIRIQEVRRALAETRRSITDIAFAAGFNNLSHFHALFRRTCGCTPRQFRHQHTRH
jgi:AraC-like DNA-binding protein